MPVTRSTKDEPLRARAGSSETTALNVPSRQRMEERSPSTTTGTNTWASTDATTTTATTTATDTTGGSAITGSGRGNGASGGTGADRADQAAPPRKESRRTSAPPGSSRRAKSTRTTSTVARRKELEAKEEIARLEFEQAQAATKLARARLELAQCEEEDADSVEEDMEDRTTQVQNWIQSSVIEERNGLVEETPASAEKGPVVETQQRLNDRKEDTVIGVRVLADALKEAFASQGTPHQPNYVHELPAFDGSSSEWIAFKVVYDDTCKLFTGAQNMARLRRAIRGTAREAIRSLLYSEATPEEIMSALQRRFGRTEALVLAELEKIKSLPRLGENPRDICMFASQVSNSVAAVHSLKKPQYLHSPEMVRQIIDKLPSILRFRWFDFSADSEDGDFSDLVKISKFLNKEADRCGAFAPLENKKPFEVEKRRTPYRQAAHAAFQQNNDRGVSYNCVMCAGQHVISDCPQFIKQSVQARWETVAKHRLCFKCLSSRHRKGTCRKPACKACGRWHHHSLHSDERHRERKVTATSASLSDNVISDSENASDNRRRIRSFASDSNRVVQCHRNASNYRRRVSCGRNQLIASERDRVIPCGRSQLIASDRDKVMSCEHSQLIASDSDREVVSSDRKQLAASESRRVSCGRNQLIASDSDRAVSCDRKPITASDSTKYSDSSTPSDSLCVSAGLDCSVVNSKCGAAAPVNVLKAARAYLKIVPVMVYGPKGSERVLALMDEGSTVSLIDAEVAERIGATGQQEELVLETVGGRLLRKKDSMMLNLKVRGNNSGKMKTINRVRTIDDLKLTPQSVEKDRIIDCLHLVDLHEVLTYEAEPPRLLIGQDNWDLIITRTVRKGPPGQPVASLTNLGWVLHGYDSRGSRPVHFINTCMHMVDWKTNYNELDELIKNHFAIESLGIEPRRPTADANGRALNILNKTCRRLPDGRFEVGLLWRTDDEYMPESYYFAKKRLESIERKIDKNSCLRVEYNNQINHLLNSNYAEEAPPGGDSRKRWYLPHFPVVHPVKKKVRIVFDAAAKSGGKSLNDALLPGPDLLQSLFGVLLRFRQGPHAVAADIKEMFLQIKIQEDDRDSLRFLWRGDDRNLPPKEYRMTSVIFGAASSPSTAIYVKNRNAEDFKDAFPAAARAVIKNHYMDDYLHSFHDEKELIDTSNNVSFIHKQAGFELRGWSSNRPELLRGISGEETAKAEVDIGGTAEEKTLGLRWLTARDCLGFRVELRNVPQEVVSGGKRPTKRQVTSGVMSTFDPLGLMSPVLLQGKRLLQSIWRSGVGWDDPVEQNDFEGWLIYVHNLELIKDLCIPRCMSPYRTEGELHTFVDASEAAYAAAVYWRTGAEGGPHVVHLVAAKARVTPLKPTSVPRLELQAAVLGSRLTKSIEKELDLKVTRKIFWSDSSVVLAWIKCDPRTFKTFVAHRLAEIEDHTRPQDWRWVPTALNPADDATRGVPERFSAEHRWFRGPEFLHDEEEHWPPPRSFGKVSTGEEKETTATLTPLKNCDLIDVNRFSSWTRMVRSVARVLQFIEKCRARAKVLVTRRQERKDPTWGRRTTTPAVKKVKTARSQAKPYVPLDLYLVEKAETILLRLSQEEVFSEDIRRLRQNKPLEGGSRLKKIDVVYENDLLYLKGRINATAAVSSEFKKPIVLHSRSRIVLLLIEHYHKTHNHGNHATVMNEIRQKFHVIGLRTSLRAVQHRCQWCRVRRAAPAEVPEGDLPPERLRHGAPPFSATAVDYFGPLLVTVGRRREKRWGALFTCLTTRAVHIELAATLSADSMLMALRRFAARRGMPRTIYSDNGTNFVGADRELREAWASLQTDGVAEGAEQLGVRWKFIPPGAPNMGGAWERLVRSIKTALSATLRERHPREEVLHTLLLEAEHIVNSRPLTNIGDNTEEEALTPNHFLIGRSSGAARVGAFGNEELVGRETWRAAQRLADHFWQRWLREYLPTLLPRKLTGRTGTTDLQPGDVVLVVDHTLPRCTWPRGRIAATYPGPDGRTRIVDVATRGGVLRRPQSKVVLLVPASPTPRDGATHEGENVGDEQHRPEE